MRERKAVIYVAGPFRAANQWEQEKNIRIAEELSWQVWKAGMVAICPHLNTKHFQGSMPDEVWLDGDLEIVRRCDAVLLAPNWSQSDGSLGERDLAIEEGIPVYESLEGLVVAFGR